MAVITAYTLYRSTVRPGPTMEETMPVAPIGMVTGTPVMAEMALEYVSEQVVEPQESDGVDPGKAETGEAESFKCTDSGPTVSADPPREA